MVSLLFTFRIGVVQVAAEQELGVDGGVPLGEVEGVTGVEHVDSTLDKGDDLKGIAASLRQTHARSNTHIILLRTLI